MARPDWGVRALRLSPPDPHRGRNGESGEYNRLLVNSVVPRMNFHRRPLGRKKEVTGSSGADCYFVALRAAPLSYDQTPASKDKLALVCRSL